MSGRTLARLGIWVVLMGIIAGFVAWRSWWQVAPTVLAELVLFGLWCGVVSLCVWWVAGLILAEHDECRGRERAL